MSKKSYCIDHLSDIEKKALISKHIKEQRKGLVSKFVGELTLHGYAQFHDASGWRKATWGIILAVTLAIIVRMVYLSYCTETYYSQVREVDTSVHDSLPFPTVTVCNIKPVFKSYMYENLGLTKSEFTSFYYQLLSNYGNVYSSNKNDVIARVRSKLKAMGRTSYKDMLQMFEVHEEVDIKNEQMWKWKWKYDGKPLESTTLLKTVARFKEQSLCKQFNFYIHGRDGLLSNGTGINNGLHMYWDISGEMYHPTYNLDFQGLLVEIHKYGTPHHLIEYTNVLYLEPGVLTSIDIEQVMTNRLHPPYKDSCGQRQLKIITNYTYSRAICEVDCLLQLQLEQCGCVSDEFVESILNTTRVCNTTEMQCVFQVSNSPTDCHSCPKECESTDYTVSTSRLGIGSNLMYKLATQGLPSWKGKRDSDIESYIHKNIVGFRVGFKSHTVETRTHIESVPWYDRLSMLGGTMGLFLGFSVMTVFEFIFFLFDYIYMKTPLHEHVSKKHIAKVEKEKLTEIYERQQSNSSMGTKRYPQF